MRSSHAIVLASPVRMAIGTFGGALKDVPATDLGAAAIKATVERWATMWQARSDAKIDHFENLMAYIARIDERPSAKKTIEDEANLVEQHQGRAA